MHQNSERYGNNFSIQRLGWGFLNNLLLRAVLENPRRDQPHKK